MKKRIYLFATAVLVSILTAFGQTKEYQLSSHILDINQGQPAPGVRITLSKQDKDAQWTVVDEKLTDKNGRANHPPFQTNQTRPWAPSNTKTPPKTTAG